MAQKPFYGSQNWMAQANVLVQGLGSLTDPTGEAIVDERCLEHFREGCVDIHHTSSSNATTKNKVDKRGGII